MSFPRWEKVVPGKVFSLHRHEGIKQGVEEVAGTLGSGNLSVGGNERNRQKVRAGVCRALDNECQGCSASGPSSSACFTSTGLVCLRDHRRGLVTGETRFDGEQ